VDSGAEEAGAALTHHPRQIIRKAVVEALAAAGLASGRVWASRAKPLSDRLVPAVLVYSPSDKMMKGSYDADGQSPLDRELTLAIEIVDLADDDDEALLENRLDAMAGRVEAVMDGFEVPGRMADIVRYQAMDSDLFERGNHVFGALLLTYTVRYRTPTREHPPVEPVTQQFLTVRLTGDPGSAELNVPQGAIIRVSDDSDGGCSPYDLGIDYVIDFNHPVPTLIRLPESMIPPGAALSVTASVPLPAAPSGVFLGEMPEVGLRHVDDYTRVVPA
jgi:hypothetical protein